MNTPEPPQQTASNRPVGEYTVSLEQAQASDGAAPLDDLSGATDLVEGSYLVAAPGFEIHENLIILHTGSCTHVPWRHHRAKRGRVTTYSSPSRLRLMRYLATVRWPELPAPCWITLTYHHQLDGSNERARQDLDAWFHRLRRAIGAGHYIWRLQLQQRGVVHYHVILWPPDWSERFQGEPYRRWLARMWHEIADPSSRPHETHGAEVVPLTSYRQAASYVARYVSTERTTDVLSYVGRRWGASRNLPRKPWLRAECSQALALAMRRNIRRYAMHYCRNRQRLHRYIYGRSTAQIFVPIAVVQRLMTWLLETTHEPWPIAIPDEAARGPSQHEPLNRWWRD